MSAFWQAMGFLTRFPVPAKFQSDKGWDKSPRYYPLVGLLIGLVVWLVSWLADYGFGSLGVPVSAAITVACWIYLTGALHLDGLMDLADGLGSHRSRERMLEIMKDSRVGAMGVVAAILLIVLKITAVQQLALHNELLILIVVPAIARFVLLGAIYYFPYIQANGIGNGLRKGVNLVTILLNLLLVVGVLYSVAGLQAGVIVVVLLLVAWLFGNSIVRKLGGFTGDVYGALVEIMETAALLVYLVILNHSIY